MVEDYELSSKLVTIYFSKDRPLQLDLTLYSNSLHSINWENQNEVVLYKASNERFQNAYNRLISEHGSVEFVKETDFKNNLLNIIKDKEYVMFAVDDTIFTSDYSLRDICSTLEVFSGAIGFSLRLGENTKYCYPLDTNNEIPEAIFKFDGGLMAFEWAKINVGDFGYPLELSSSVYRTKDIMLYLSETNYNNPNSLEWNMDCNKTILKNLPYLVCFRKSVAFSNPVNKIQQTNNNRSGNLYENSIEYYLEKYEEGYRIHPEDFVNFTSIACHQLVEMNLKKVINE